MRLRSRLQMSEEWVRVSLSRCCRAMLHDEGEGGGEGEEGAGRVVTIVKIPATRRACTVLHSTQKLGKVGAAAAVVVVVA